MVTFVVVHYLISVQANDNELSLLSHFLQEIYVTNMEEIKGTSDVSGETQDTMTLSLRYGENSQLRTI